MKLQMSLMIRKHRGNISFFESFIDIDYMKSRMINKNCKNKVRYPILINLTLSAIEEL
jgi:hypothetical protein